MLYFKIKPLSLNKLKAYLGIEEKSLNDTKWLLAMYVMKTLMKKGYRKFSGGPDYFKLQISQEAV